MHVIHPTYAKPLQIHQSIIIITTTTTTNISIIVSAPAISTAVVVEDIDAFIGGDAVVDLAVAAGDAVGEGEEAAGDGADNDEERGEVLVGGVAEAAVGEGGREGVEGEDGAAWEELHQCRGAC